MRDLILPAKYKLLVQFYGVEEYIEYALPLPNQIETLSSRDSEFLFKKKLLDLDIWYSRAYDRPGLEQWNPFTESFRDFDKRSDFVIAQYLPEKQYADRQILQFIR